MAPGEVLCGEFLTGLVLWMDTIDTVSTVPFVGVEKVILGLCVVNIVAVLSSKAGGVVYGVFSSMAVKWISLSLMASKVKVGKAKVHMFSFESS